MKRYFLLFILILLSACGDDSEEVKEVRDSELTQQANTVIGTPAVGCQTGELETWYETASVNAQMFQDEARTFADLGPDSAPAALDRLIELQEATLTVPVPECMADLNGLMQTLMQATIEDFRQYSTLQIQQGEVQERVRLARERYDAEVLPLLQQTEAQLVERLQEGN